MEFPGLARWCAAIQRPTNVERRRLDLMGKHYRATGVVISSGLVKFAPQTHGVEEWDVRCEVLAYPVGYGRERHRRRKSLVLSNEPGRHEAPIAPAGNPDALRIGYAICYQLIET